LAKLDFGIQTQHTLGHILFLTSSVPIREHFQLCI